MIKRILLLGVFFGSVPFILLVFILLSLYTLHGNSRTTQNTNMNLFTKNVQYKALPEISEGTQISIGSNDARVDAVKNFLSIYRSPLLPFAEMIVKTADKYKIDYRLVPAIAMQESTLCKKIPKDSYNCWGFGIYGKKITRFSGFDEGIETVSKGIARDYVAKGLTDPNEIMKKYTPSNTGTWADSVSLFMGKLAYTNL